MQYPRPVSEMNLNLRAQFGMPMAYFNWALTFCFLICFSKSLKEEKVVAVENCG